MAQGGGPVARWWRGAGKGRWQRDPIPGRRPAGSPGCKSRKHLVLRGVTATATWPADVLLWTISCTRSQIRHCPPLSARRRCSGRRLTPSTGGRSGCGRTGGAADRRTRLEVAAKRWDARDAPTSSYYKDRNACTISSDLFDASPSSPARHVHAIVSNPPPLVSAPPASPSSCPARLPQSPSRQHIHYTPQPPVAAVPIRTHAPPLPAARWSPPPLLRRPGCKERQRCCRLAPPVKVHHLGPQPPLAGRVRHVPQRRRGVRHGTDERRGALVGGVARGLKVGHVRVDVSVPGGTQLVGGRPRVVGAAGKGGRDGAVLDQPREHAYGKNAKSSQVQRGVVSGGA